ncbi:MAG: hypothetical protein J1F11_03745 [Oscillospiraceae bacterium]|nr:hypothetical protein [Oscillospiraceae bacterium]
MRNIKHDIAEWDTVPIEPKELDRQFTGCEIDGIYFKAAEKRINAESNKKEIHKFIPDGTYRQG